MENMHTDFRLLRVKAGKNLEFSEPILSRYVC